MLQLDFILDFGLDGLRATLAKLDEFVPSRPRGSNGGSEVAESHDAAVDTGRRSVRNDNDYVIRLSTNRFAGAAPESSTSNSGRWSSVVHTVLGRMS